MLSSSAALINECLHLCSNESKNSNNVSPSESFFLELQENNLFIFQCKSCNKILADSSTLQKDDSKNDLIVFKNNNTALSPSPIAINSDLQTCLEEGTDEFGSTYHIIKCRDCSYEIGKMYRTTSPLLDSLRGMFTINLYSLTRYKIHTNESIKPVIQTQTQTTKKSKNSLQTAGGEGDSSLEIAKLQKFSLFLYQRLCALEEYCKDLSSSFHSSQKNEIELEERKKRSKSKHHSPTLTHSPIKREFKDASISIAPTLYEVEAFNETEEHQKPSKSARKSDGSLAPGEYGPVRKVGRPRKLEFTGKLAKIRPPNNVTIRED